MKDSTFEECLKKCRIEIRQSIIDVVDAMGFMRVWFDRYNIVYTANDLLRGAEMILLREENVINAEYHTTKKPDPVSQTD